MSKYKRNSNIETKNSKKTYMIFLFLISVFCISSTFMFSKRIFATNITNVSNNIDNIVFLKNENPINLEEILKNNINSTTKEEMIIEEIDLEYTTIYRNNNNLSKGTIQVLQEGRDGKRDVIIIRKYKDEVLISEQVVSENLIKASIDKIVEVGTGSGKNSYKAKIGDVLYTTSSSLVVRLEPDENSQKICTVKSDTEVKVIQIDNNWYYVSVQNKKGYIPVDCVTNINKNITRYDESDSNINSDLIKKLDFNIALNEKSNLSLDQFKKILIGNSNDKNKVLENNAEYFYYAERQYSINGIFLASVAIHESGWGTSNIANVKKNLFGYGAYDSNPMGGAYTFGTYAEGIDLVARVFVKYYLNAPNTKIYDGNITSGKYYNGNTLSSVNIKYASDKNWANSVYKWMQYLYGKL